MNVACKHCHAWHWLSEKLRVRISSHSLRVLRLPILIAYASANLRLQDSPYKNPRFGSCCLRVAVHVNILGPLPDWLIRLLPDHGNTRPPVPEPPSANASPTSTERRAFSEPSLAAPRASARAIKGILTSQ